MPEPPAEPLDPEQPITDALLSRLYIGMQLREDIPPRLVARALGWAAAELGERANKIARARHALETKD